MRTLAWLLALTMASAAGAQSRVTEIRAIGEHNRAGGEGAEWAGQAALADARRRAVGLVAARLQDRDDVKALRLTPVQLEAFTAALVEIDEDVPSPAPPDAQSVRAEVRVHLDADDTARRMSGLRRDQEASHAVVAAWRRMEQIHAELVNRERAPVVPTGDDTARLARERNRAFATLQAAQLAARGMAAMARTEPTTVGGRVPAADGRARAQRLSEAALALAPDSLDAHLLAGDLLMDAEKPAAAEARYRVALLADASSGAARVKLAEALRLQGRLAEAAGELREALRVDPDSARAHSDLALVLRSQRSVPEAIAAYREAIRLDPDWIDARNGLAIALANEKRLDEAVAEFREIVRIDPDSTIGYYNLAYALADLDRDVESAAALREVIRINPDHYNARYNLGELFRLEGKYDDSARQFREYLRLAPDAPQNSRNIQRARRFIEQFEEPPAREPSIPD